MSQNIQLQQVGINGMVIKMGCDDIAVHIVGRMLHRGKFFNVPSNGKNDNTAWVLACGPAHTCAALDNTVDLAVPLSLSPFFIVILYIAESCFLRQGADGSGLKSLARAENNLYIPVGFSLIIAGEIQVDIRLLVSLKSQESFKGNVKSFFL